MKNYWCPKHAETFREVSEEEAARLAASGEFVTNSLAQAAFYYL